MKKLEEYVRSIPDFPEEGIIFRDVTSVLQDAEGLHLAISTMQELVKDGVKVGDPDGFRPITSARDGRRTGGCGADAPGVQDEIVAVPRMMLNWSVSG